MIYPFIITIRRNRMSGAATTANTAAAGSKEVVIPEF
jgi:hypothetical protein